jgi:hypothetical protein
LAARHALALSADGQRLYQQPGPDIGVFDLAPLLNTGAINVPALASCRPWARKLPRRC